SGSFRHVFVLEGCGATYMTQPLGPSEQSNRRTSIFGTCSQCAATSPVHSPSTTTTLRGLSCRSASSRLALCPTSQLRGSGKPSHLKPSVPSLGQAGKMLSKSKRPSSSFSSIPAYCARQAPASAPAGEAGMYPPELRGAALSTRYGRAAPNPT